MSATKDNSVSCGLLHIHKALKEARDQKESPYGGYATSYSNPKQVIVYLLILQ